MSKLKRLLQWYRQPVGLLWLVATTAILAGTLLAIRPLIAAGVAVLVLVLLPNKDQQSFMRRRAGELKSEQALQIESKRVDDTVKSLHAARAAERKELALQLNDHYAEVDRRMSQVAAQQVEIKHAQLAVNQAAEDTIAGAGRLDAIVHSRIDGLDEQIRSRAAADQLDRLRQEVMLLRGQLDEVQASDEQVAAAAQANEKFRGELADVGKALNLLQQKVDGLPTGVEARLDTRIEDLSEQLARRVAETNGLADRTEALELQLQDQGRSVARVAEQIDKTSSTILCDGSSRSFYLPRGYRRRLYVEEDFDDTGNEDEWQREVYDYALGVAQQLDAKSVCDFGCGSGFKLVDRFEKIETTGIDRDEVVHVLRDRYPNREWLVTPKVIQPDTFAGFDLVIASDVIEHLADPVELLTALAKSDVANIVLSTPARDLLSEADGHLPLGPPRNQTHFCEWTFDEFAEMVADHLDVVLHRVSNRHQATQLIHARPKL